MMKQGAKHFLSCLLSGALLASPALAQQGVQIGDRQAPAERRVGVDQSKRLRLTLREAITMALEHNRDIEVELLPACREYGIAMVHTNLRLFHH